MRDRLVTCEVCGVQFPNSRSYGNKRIQRFCSRKCGGVAIRGSSHPYYKGGARGDGGYHLTKIDGRYRRTHRLIMEEHLGRPLLPTEVVHHIDGNPQNNAIENLQLLPNNGLHRKEHTTVFRSDTHKECTRCHAVKARSEFSPRSRKGRPQGDRHHSWCKECLNAMQRHKRAESKILRA